MHEVSHKITPQHLQRKAYLYIRQSSLKQVMDNQESTKRQYALKDRAMALGWSRECIEVIDHDQGQSGAGALDRVGFQKLVAEVGLGQAGLVMGLEVSRLARNCADWHRLIEICALTHTLILDEDGIYDPSHFNDRLLLGLKGTMSEAELHVLRARLRGGILNKARRGELKLPLPVGFIYNDEDRVVLDPNSQVQESIRLLFKTFERTSSTYLMVKYFRERKLKFPRRPTILSADGDVIWVDLVHWQALRILHNPRYAGIFAYGQRRHFRDVHGKYRSQKLPQDQWTVFLPDTHEGYITQEQFQLNQRRLLDNAQAHGKDRTKSPPREGPALLQGIVVCGRCGRRMTVRYHHKGKKLYPDYLCQNDGINHARKICQSIPGTHLDRAIGELLVELMTPLTLEVALAVQQELSDQMAETNRLRKKNVDQARYEAELAQRRYMRVDPDHRLVADSLEAKWNEKLRALSQVQEVYERNTKKDQQVLDENHKKQILALATDFPKLWKDAKTPDRERKRMVRLLIEDVTLSRNQELIAQIRFKGGATKILHLPLPLNGFMARQTDPKIVKKVDALLNQNTHKQIAEILNDQGERTGDGFLFTARAIYRIQLIYGLKKRRKRLEEKGMITRKEILKKLGVGQYILKKWKDQGFIKVHAYGDHSTMILYEPMNRTQLTRLMETRRGGELN